MMSIILIIQYSMYFYFKLAPKDRAKKLSVFFVRLDVVGGKKNVMVNPKSPPDMSIPVYYIFTHGTNIKLLKIKNKQVTIIALFFLYIFILNS